MEGSSASGKTTQDCKILKKKEQRLGEVRLERRKGTPQQLENILLQIHAQAEALRVQKTELGGQGEGAAWRKEDLFKQIFKLMNLKYEYCRLFPTPIAVESHKELFVETEPPHCIKIRWKVRKAPTAIGAVIAPATSASSTSIPATPGDAKDKQKEGSTEIKAQAAGQHGEVIRLQVPFRDVTTVSGRQIIDSIQLLTNRKSKLPEQNGFVKIEVVVTDSLGKEEEVESIVEELKQETVPVPQDESGEISSSTEKNEECSTSSTTITTATTAIATVTDAEKKEEKLGEAKPEEEGKTDEKGKGKKVKKVKVHQLPPIPAHTKKQYRAVLSDDVFALPLIFPGPVLQSELHLNVRVTWPEVSNNLITPKSFEHNTHLPELIDCGVNLFDPMLKSIATKVVNRGFGAGVSQMVLISVNPETSEWSVKYCKLRQRSLFATVGVHPDDAQNLPLTEEEVERLRKLLKEECVVAVGECGMDKKRAAKGRRTNNVKVSEETEEAKSKRVEENLVNQEKWLVAQIQLALEAKKPLFFHVRQAHDRFMKVIEPFKEKLRGNCLVNCFTGDEKELKDYLDLGFCIGITGFLANKRRGEELQKLMKQLPLNNIMLGSDAPYLIPFSMEKPYPKWNEPAFLQHVLALASECMEVSANDLAAAATKNTRRLFNLPTLPYDGTIRKFTSYSSNVYKAPAKLVEDKPKHTVTPAAALAFTSTAAPAAAETKPQ